MSVFSVFVSVYKHRAYEGQIGDMQANSSPVVTVWNLKGTLLVGCSKKPKTAR
jgi:hypothetical protein